MIGAIIGDIVGSKYEFGGMKTKDFPLNGEMLKLCFEAHRNRVEKSGILNENCRFPGDL